MPPIEGLLQKKFEPDSGPSTPTSPVVPAATPLPPPPVRERDGTNILMFRKNDDGEHKPKEESSEGESEEEESESEEEEKVPPKPSTKGSKK